MVDLDYVIVGAGAAGCVLASRLSEDLGNQVLLLEYGAPDTNPLLYIPEGYYYIHHGETAAELNALARTAKHLMNWVMRDLGPVLTALPVGPSHPARPPARPSTSPARPSSCCRTRTRPGRSSRNSSTHWSRPALPSASERASARSPRSPKSCSR